MSLVVDYDRDGTRRVSSGDVALPGLDQHGTDRARWGIFGQFRRGATDPAGTASYFDVLFHLTRGLGGRWYLRVR